MSHHHWHWYKRHHMLYGPSRLVWFAIGSVATWAWIHRHHQGGPCPPRVDYRSRAQREREEASDAFPPDYGERRQTPSLSREWRPTGAPDPRLDPHGGRRGPVATAIADAQLPSPQDLERLRQLGRSAEDTISGMSEATIDSMVGALQRLKDRLAERRGQQQFQEIESQQIPTPATPPEDPPRSRHWI